MPSYHCSIHEGFVVRLNSLYQFLESPHKNETRKDKRDWLYHSNNRIGFKLLVIIQSPVSCGQQNCDD